MNRMIYGESVQGASHIRADKECQDSFKFIEVSNDIAIMAVADGHGSDSCPYSKTGSIVAVNVFCKVMEDLLDSFKDNPSMLLTYLNREGDTKVASMIDLEWKKRIRKNHKNKKREKVEDEATLYKMYGSTLLGLLITKDFLFSFQLGDGDIVYVDDQEARSLIEGDKILGTETHSLCKLDSWKKALTEVRILSDNENPHAYFMSTDGFANSYKSEAEFYKTCKEYYSMIQQYGFEAVSKNLCGWLNETSELGCGDDITMLMCYFDKEVESDS